MNDEPNDDFEQRLSRIEFTPPSPRLRERVLAALEPEPALPEATPIPWWRSIFWPCPQAWLGFAASWMLMWGLNRSTVTHADAAPPTRMAVESAPQLHREWYPEEYALLEAPAKETPAAKQPKRPGPHSHLRRRETDYA